MADAADESSGDRHSGSTTEDVGIRLVVQRCNSAELLVDNVDQWVGIGWGLVCSISFAPAADVAKVHKAVKLLLNAPLLSRGHWGDGDAPKCLIDMCIQSEASQKDADGSAAEGEAVSKPSVMIIPTASLTSKVKNGGRVLSYRGQCDKDQSRDLYFEFVHAMRSFAPGMVDNRVGGPKSSSNPTQKQKRPQGPLCSPQDLFRVGEYAGRFSTFDTDGMPLTGADGEPVSKSMTKKLAKVRGKHIEKYDKQRALGIEAAVAPAPTDAAGSEEQSSPSTLAEAPGEGAGTETPSFENDNGPDARLRVVAGTFGNRQGFRLDASLGPFTHIFTL